MYLQISERIVKFPVHDNEDLRIRIIELCDIKRHNPGIFQLTRDSMIKDSIIHYKQM